ncbi:hypothetical protein ACIBHY_20240 [Nonomuraea sp. NPDC050547]|uniref:hypothetical protein n=1 Tax=Nonomuraea sp. NPDC050547 TaxID=3364368 RepID=UPI003791D2F3
MKIGYKESDRELFELATRISHAFRRWKIRLALGGVVNIEQAHVAFSLALLNVCDGDWELLAATEHPNEGHRSRPVVRVFLRILALLASLGLLFASILLASMFPAGLSAAVTTACTVMVIAQLLAILDPSASARYDTGIKILEASKK